MENKMLKFRLAESSEKSAIFELYNSVKGTEFCAWDESYPGIAEIENDFNSKSLYVLIQGDMLVGALSVVPQNELDDFDCWDINDGRQKEIARIVIAPNHRGKGYARIMINEITDILSNSLCSAIHLSASAENLPALSNYKKLGFSIKSKVHIYDGEYYLLERII